MKSPHSASSSMAPADVAPTADSAEAPWLHRKMLWGFFASFLLVGLICVGLALQPREQLNRDQEAFSSLDLEDDIFLGNAELPPPTPGIWGSPREDSTTPGVSELPPQPELPAWTDVANVLATASYEEEVTAAQPTNRATSHQASAPRYGLGPEDGNPVWLEGTIELTFDDDTAPSAFGQQDRTATRSASRPSTTYR